MCSIWTTVLSVLSPLFVLSGRVYQVAFRPELIESQAFVHLWPVWAMAAITGIAAIVLLRRQKE